MTGSGRYQAAVDRACGTDPGGDDIRKGAFDEIIVAINERNLPVADLAVLLAGPLTSPEKEARENGTLLLGEVVGRCRDVLGEGELHTLAEFLAARLRDWPCVGAAAAACRALLQSAPGGAAGGEGSEGPRLRDDSAALVLEATAEVLRSAQSFRQDDRSALLQLLLAAARGWGRVAGRRGVPLLDAFLGAADGEKDPRCLMLAFEAVRALCEMHHSPGVDPEPLRQLADELVDWTSAYFPISFNPPPSLARGPAAITRTDLAASLEGALAASPFLAGAVLPLLVEKLSSTYRPAKEDALAALRRCCPAYGPDALAPHVGQLWPALRSEVMAPCGQGGAAAAPLAAGSGGGGAEAEARLALAANAAGCLTVAVRAAGPGALDSLALQDACVGDLLAMLRSGDSPTRGSSTQAVARADGQVQCGALVLAAIAAADPASLMRTHTSALGHVAAALAESLAATEAYGSRADQTLYGMTVLSAVVDAVAAELRPARGADGGGESDGRVRWLLSGAAEGLAALAEVKAALLAAVAALNGRLRADGAAEAEAAEPSQPECYSPADAAQLRLAVVGVWSSLLRLHAAAAAAAAAAAPVIGASAAAAGMVRQLTLTAGDLQAAAGQLCDCALESSTGPEGPAGPASAPMKARMRWGRPTDTAVEATSALQLLLQLQPVPDGDGREGLQAEREAVVRLLVGRLTGAMAGAAAGGGNGDDDGGAAEVRAAALRLSVRLAESPANGFEGEAPAAAAAFTAALLETLQPLLLRGAAGGGADEQWLLDCLQQLATQVLPAFAPGGAGAGGRRGGGGAAPAKDPAQQPVPSAAAAAAAAPPHPPVAAISAAAAGLVTATLRAAAAWEATADADAPGSAGESTRGLPFGRAATGGVGPAAEGATHGSVALPPVLMQAWCAAVQQLTTCCEDGRQLELTMEATESIAACSARLADARATAAAAAAAAAPLPTWHCPALAASVPLACAIIAGLRVGVLAPQSTQALTDNLLGLLLAAPASLSEQALTAAAVALAAAVNRWGDAASLDSWLTAAFRPALLERLTRMGLAAAAARSDMPLNVSGTAAASVAAVRAVGWVGRALALRNHPALHEVVEALLGCLRAEQDGAAPGAAAAVGAAAAGTDAAAAAAATVMDVDVAAGEATAAPRGGVALGQDGDVDMTAGAAAAEQPGCRGTEQACIATAGAAAAAAAAAADAFGVLVAEEASAGGVALVARPPLAVCRVLWQQRTYSLCAQALEKEYQRVLQHRQPQAPGVAALQVPLLMALAVARLAGSAAQQLCRNDARRLAALLLRSVQALSRALQGAGSPADAAALAAAGPAAAAAALLDGLGVLRSWLGSPAALPSEQLEKVLQEHVEDLVESVCAAARVGTAGQQHRPAGPGFATWAAAATSPPPPVSPPSLDAAVATAVREEALRCCASLMDALPYHVLHPLRQQVLNCLMRALDDNRRSVRQLAVKARRAWGDS